MSVWGVVKSYNPLKGFGFLTQSDGQDVFVHISACNGMVPNQGDALTFDVEWDPKSGKPQAKNVQGCTGSADGAAKGGGKGKGQERDGSEQGDSLTFDVEWDPKSGKPQAKNVQGCTGSADGAAKGGGKGKGQDSGRCQGTVKCYNGEKGWGFVEYNGTDLFLHVKSCNGGTPQAGDWLTFDVEDAGQGNGKLKASNVSGCTGWPEKGMGKGDKGGYGAMWGGGKGCTGSADGAAKGGGCTGWPEKGMGKGDKGGYGAMWGGGKGDGGKGGGWGGGPYGGGKDGGGKDGGWGKGKGK
eukprot:CAMPEP_0183485048 /NCGR_PEP_ID=MMETSP0370-20130417/179228_1 /TAXON_ID=268820 /ORGANISM="Peridinium aciculiferum, Strain PAER-2" /LENGTH=296 /DNA_ID=CAMNT_0025678345 /DNA_START=59 /DNA_END=950 /DNA_ORIENTATION=-